MQLERYHTESVLGSCKPPPARPAARLRRRCSGSREADGGKYVINCWPQDLVYLPRRDQCKGPGRLTFHDRRSLAIVCHKSYSGTEPTVSSLSRNLAKVRIGPGKVLQLLIRHLRPHQYVSGERRRQTPRAFLPSP